MTSKYLPEIQRLKKIKGQIEGVISMIESEKYCIDILNQLTAVYAATASARAAILEKHLDVCIKNAILNEDADRFEKISELMNLLKKF
jgi:DNA-binding FrmR family transcriptional regulator